MLQPRSLSFFSSTDTGNGRIRYISPTYMVSTLTPFKALNAPYGVTLGDSPNYILVADTGNNRIIMLLLNSLASTNNPILQIAGPWPSSPIKGATDGYGPSATFNGPHGLVMDAATGWIYVAGAAVGDSR